jgi:hypothetical protein
MKAAVIDSNSSFVANCINYTDSNGKVSIKAVGLEIELLKVVLQKLNMSLLLFPTQYNFSRIRKSFAIAIISKNIDLALGGIVEHFMFGEMLEATKPFSLLNFRWYVPCSIKLPRWSSIYRILSVELWLVLIISLVLAAISITLVARYSYTSEWQDYKSLTSSLTNVYSVYLGVSVSTMPRSNSLRSLFITWVCFSLAFSTVIQAFLTQFLIESGYETPIQNMEELFASGFKFAYAPGQSYIFHKSFGTEASKVLRNLANCPSFVVCVEWAMNQKNTSVLLSNLYALLGYSTGYFAGENAEPLLCSLKDGVVFHSGQVMLMLHGDPLLRRVNEIICRVVEAGIYNYWLSLLIYTLNLQYMKIGIVQLIDEYYSFNFHHMLPAFYLLLMGWCLSALCFMFEVLYNRVLKKQRKVKMCLLLRIF